MALGPLWIAATDRRDRGGVVVKLHPRTEVMGSDSLTVNPLFARRAEDLSVPRFALPATGMLPETAYQLVHDEAMLDGNARLNLATFVTTWMEPLAAQLYRDTFDKNMIDKDEYPLTAAIEERCWRMLADLWHAPDPKTTIGTSTVGSSEACMLGGLALKRRWQIARRAAGKSTDQPNLVMSRRRTSSGTPSRRLAGSRAVSLTGMRAPTIRSVRESFLTALLAQVERLARSRSCGRSSRTTGTSRPATCR
jgi:hypothetical protein